MPLIKGKGEGAFKANVRTLMGEVGKSPHVQSRAQALAIAYSKKRTGKKYGGLVSKAEGGWLDLLWPKKKPPPEPVVSAIKQDPPSTEFPDEADTFRSKYVGRTYGDPVEGYTNPGKSYVRDVSSSGVKAWNREPMEGGVKRLTSPEDAESMHRQWIAAERSPVAKLGFQPGKMMQTPNARLTVGGLYDPNTDQSWYDTTHPDHAVHESMHRGLYMLRRAGALPKDLPSDEMLVRALMQRHLGNIELGRGDAGDRQVRQARAVKPEVLDAVEAAAADYVAQKRPGGPRAEGGAVTGMVPVEEPGVSGGVVPGLLVPGNINLHSRPIVKNPDGSISTVRSMSFGDEQGQVLIPTVHPEGRIMSNDEAIRHYYNTKSHLGIFDTPENAILYSRRLHEDQEKEYFPHQEDRATGGSVMNPWMAAGGAAIKPRVDTAPWYQRNAMRKGATHGMLGGASPGRVDNLPIKVKSGSYVVPADIVSAIGQGNSQSGAKMLSQSKMFSGSKMNKYGGGNFRMTGVSGLRRGQFAEGGWVPPSWRDAKPFLSIDSEQGAPTFRGGLSVPMFGGTVGISGHHFRPAPEALPDRGLKLEYRRPFAEGGEAGPGEVDIGPAAGVLGEQNPIISAMSTSAKSGPGVSKDVPIIAASGEFVLSPEQVMAFGDGDMKRGHDALDRWVMAKRKELIKTLQNLKKPKKD